MSILDPFLTGKKNGYSPMYEKTFPETFSEIAKEKLPENSSTTHLNNLMYLLCFSYTQCTYNLLFQALNFCYYLSIDQKILPVYKKFISRLLSTISYY